MRHVNKAHAFKAHELPVSGPGQFTADNTADSANFADEVGLVGNGGKGEAGMVTATGSEGKTDGDTGWMVGSLAGMHMGTTGYTETAIRKGTAKGTRSRQGLETTRAAMPPVPGAIWPRGEG